MIKTVIRALAVCLCASLLFSIFTGCSKENVSIAPAENVYEESYGLSTLVQSPDITIDGILDETAWQNKGWFKNTYPNTQGELPTIELTAFPTEYGVYIASVIYDKNLVSDGQHYPEVDTNLELYIAASNVGEELISKAYNGAWSKHQIHIDMEGGTYGLLANVERAVVVDGELNSGATNSATLEILVGWETLGVDLTKGVPETVGILPCYRGVLIAGSATSWVSPAGASFNNPGSYHVFDENGYTSVDSEDAILGNAYNGYSKSGGWDVSQAKQGIVHSERGGSGFIFFSKEFGENFVVEASLIPVASVNDAWPKAGICFYYTDGVYYSVMLDPGGKNGAIDSINGTKNFPNYQLVTLDLHDGNWNQYSLSGYDKTNPDAAKKEGVKLTVMKYGNQLWYFADGKFLTSQTVAWMEGKCFPGLYTLGYDVIFKDFSCNTITLDDLSKQLNGIGISLIETDVDGRGGKVTANSGTVKDGESYTLTFTVDSGYQLASVMCNGEEIVEKVRANAKDGVYTVMNATGNQNIKVSFEKIEGVTYTGELTDGEETLRGDMILIGKADGSAYYVGKAGGNKGFEFVVPAGTYEVRVRTEGNQWQSSTVTLTADTQAEIVYQAIPENG